jgi:hypothetical protein
VNRTKSGLWIAHGFNIGRLRKRERTVTLPNGERAKVTVDDSGTVCQIETGERLDGIVRPAPIRYTLTAKSPGTQVGGFAKPFPLRVIGRNPKPQRGVRP